MANIKPILKGTQIALEKEASDRFGAAVEDFSKSIFGRPTIDSSGNPIPVNRNDGSFYASSYAHALAGGTSYRPKLKFLFKVEFVFTEEARAAFPGIFGGGGANDFTFMVKSVDRPKIDFEYEDDVNMYNFRTKVLKKIRHRELTITFLDDTGNRVLKFFRGLMMLYSPITRRQLARDGRPSTEKPDAKATQPLAMQGSGMQFSYPSGDGFDPSDTAIRGSVSPNVSNVIDTIRVKQIYIDPGANIKGATKEIIFDFINARLVSFDLDDLNHEVSEANTMTMQFDYDWMEIVDVGSLSKMDGPEYSVSVAGVNGAPVDMSVAVAGVGLDDPGKGNTFLNIISNQTGRAAQQITSSAISRGVTSIAGKGRFASLIGSQASNILGGLVGASARDLVSGVSGVSQATARPQSGSGSGGGFGVTSGRGVGRSLGSGGGFGVTSGRGVGRSLGGIASGIFGNIFSSAVNSIRTSPFSGSVNARVIDTAEGGPVNVISVVKSNDTESFYTNTNPNPFGDS